MTTEETSSAGVATPFHKTAYVLLKPLAGGRAKAAE